MIERTFQTDAVQASLDAYDAGVRKQLLVMATGTGKTHTMAGLENDHKERGVMPRAFEDVFKSIEYDSVKTQFLVRASYLEIYNEEIRDLLSKNPKNKLELHEKPDSGVYTKDLSYFAVKNVQEIQDVMNIG